MTSADARHVRQSEVSKIAEVEAGVPGLDLGAASGLPLAAVQQGEIAVLQHSPSSASQPGNGPIDCGQ
jgi:hypothetical protein